MKKVSRRLCGGLLLAAASAIAGCSIPASTASPDTSLGTVPDAGASLDQAEVVVLEENEQAKKIVEEVEATTEANDQSATKEVKVVDIGSLDAILADAIAAMNLPDNSQVSATLIDLNTGEEATYQDQLSYPAGLVKLVWSIKALQANPEIPSGLNRQVQVALGSNGGTEESIIASNTAANNLLTEYLAEREVAVCDRREDRILESMGSTFEGSFLRRVYAYQKDHRVLAVEPDGCDLQYPRNAMKVSEIAWAFQQLAEGGGTLGLNVDATKLILDTLKRDQFQENGQPWSHTQGFMAEWLPEYVTVFSSAGSTQDDGRIEGALILYHPSSEVIGRYVVAASVPPGYDEALPQLSASIYQNMTKRYEP